MTVPTAGLLDADLWHRRLTELIATHRVVGSALAVARLHDDGDRDLVVTTAGVTNVRTGTPVGPDTLFQIGSHSKIWTTTLLMQLVDEGRLDLDEPLVTILPGLRLPPAEVMTTTRHLLTHQAGIDGDAIDSWDLDDQALARFVEQLAGAGRVTEVGELWSYSNNAFNLAGRVVEVLRGMTWEAALQTYVVEPLGLGRVVTSAEEAILHSAAVGHLPGADGVMAPTPRWGIPRKDNAAGGVATRVADLAEFMLMHLRGGVGSNGAQILSRPAASAMLVPQVVPAEGVPLGDLSGQGLGWHLSDWSGTEMFGHDGGTFGQYSHVLALPAHGLVLAVTATGGDVLEFFAAFDRYVKDALGIPHGRRAADVAEPGAVPDPGLIGVYEREAMTCRIFADAGTLKLGITPRGPLHDVLEQGSDEQVVDLTVLSPLRVAYGVGAGRRALELVRTDRGNEYLWLDVAIPKVS